jgi:translation elongation factor EF-Ts
MTHFHRHITSYVHHGRIGVLVEFDVPERTARDAAFLAIAHGIAMHIAASSQESLESLLRESYVVDPDITMEELLRESAIVLQTRFAITRFVRWIAEPEKPTELPDPPRTPAVIQRIA